MALRHRRRDRDSDGEQQPRNIPACDEKRLMDGGNETVTNCHGLKMTAADGKQRMTDVADTEQLLRLIQSIPSPKAEPFERWLAQVGYERLEEIENPELATKRMQAIYEQKTERQTHLHPRKLQSPSRSVETHRQEDAFSLSAAHTLADLDGSEFVAPQRRPRSHPTPLSRLESVFVTGELFNPPAGSRRSRSIWRTTTLSPGSHLS
jgi:hypothetical protein